jgi:cyclase
MLRWVVPGHGPIANKSSVRDLKHYLEYVRDKVRERFDAGMGYEEAARGIALDAFASWTDPGRIIVNVYAFYREFRAEPHPLGVSDLCGSMASYHDKRKAGVSLPRTHP